RLPRLELGELTLELLLLVEELLEAPRQLEWRDPEQGGRLAERRFLLDHVTPRVLARHRLDAAHPRGDGSLVDDLEQADLAGAVQMRAAAELGGEVADPDDADAIAIFLAEQRHGAALERLLQVHLDRIHREVRLDLLVDDLFHLLDLAVLEPGAVREI